MRIPASLILCLFAGLAAAAPPGPVLTLERAETRSLQNHPSLDELRERIRAAEERAVAEGELDDPRLSAGFSNVPVDTFDLDQEPMTQVQVGLHQDFPPPGTLGLRERQERQKGEAYRWRRADTRAELVRRVRKAWLERFYLDRALAVVAENLELFEELLSIARSQYRVGEGLQQEVLLAQLERDKLLDKQTDLERQRAAADSRLAKLLTGREYRFRLPEALPELPDPPARDALGDTLPEHPKVRAMDARIRGQRTGADLARKAALPKMGVDLTYGHRPGSASDGEAWADFVTARFRVSLPLFTADRQDRELAAALAERDALEHKRRNMLLDLRSAARSQRAALEASKRRVELYEDTIIPESAQTVEASVAAYTTGRLGFLDLVRSRIEDFEHQLDKWRLRVDVEQAKADLLYLAADGEGER
ncbi:TolC family protein [Thiohalorhabdus denitrificans]|uniref:Outer membrane protein TolC n=1 Tax=Thiohalorhabdus denitrificans TaxID=381306 RepID=A0A1G5CNF2_9GAMM|nr:TolC family protein [Thiohalorhabdus denitrificans]SCY04079.1 Outer membrane protein TolC [Thiohalorhabdus denitrificans]